MTKTMKAFITLLEKYGFYVSNEEIKECLDNGWELELSKKAYGNSSEKMTSEVFMNDYEKLMSLAKSLNIKISSYVWFD